MQEAADKQSLNAAQVLQTSARLSEDLIKQIRDSWGGTFVIKGILSPKSAQAAMRIGADGIIVSNHGGRQLDSAPSSIETLPRIVKAVEPRLTIMLDSGIRCGTDIIKAFASGASFTFSGRSFMFGIGALDEQGAEFVLDLMVNEVDKVLAQIGCKDIMELDREYIWQDG
jgi:isopentenyl diphosphate isomerase/L-lactate dehydrogenase-like FMN-dependent dehydrogenase